MVAVIGDIHGCYYTLESLFSKIKAKYSSIPVFSTGDLVDRGKYSLEVVEFVLANQIQPIMGNHELMFYNFFYEPDSMAARSWMFNGSEATLKSYDQRMDVMRRHLTFLIDRPISYYLEDCVITHAGIGPKYKSKLPLNSDDSSAAIENILKADAANDFGVLWNRDRLLNIKKLQIVGHTKQPEVRYDKKSDAYYIDTGAYAGNKLSAVIVHNNRLIEIIESETDQRDIN